MNKMTFACLAGVAAACGLAAWSTIKWYKGRESQDKKRGTKVAEQQEYNEAIAKQLA
jgi:hypothetical protein